MWIQQVQPLYVAQRENGNSENASPQLPLTLMWLSLPNMLLSLLAMLTSINAASPDANNNDFSFSFSFTADAAAAAQGPPSQQKDMSGID